MGKKHKKPVELVIEVASRAYPDDSIHRAYKGEEVGDGLAEFLARELENTSDERSLIQSKMSAIKALEVVAKQVADVLEAVRAIVDDK